MSVPQVIMVAFLSVGLASSCLLHGREIKKNFFLSVLDYCIFIGLLIWGGFFD